MSAEKFMWELLIQHSSASSEASLCSLVLDPFIRDLPATILGFIKSGVAWLVSVDRP
jgi:hypothetical protein